MNLPDLIIDDKEKVLLSDVFLSEQNREQIELLIKENRFAQQLAQYGLPINNKVLLFGSSGCGKTTTAKAIANSLSKKLIILNLSNVVSSRIGETSQNLKMVFDRAARDKAVLFLDEFDQIGKERSGDEKDVGEMRRLVNTIIQMIDYFPQDAVLICATNYADMIDFALMRRFQLRISFTMPSESELNKYYDKILSPFPVHLQSLERKYGVSFAEAKDYAFMVTKARLIAELEAGLEIEE